MGVALMLFLNESRNVEAAERRAQPGPVAVAQAPAPTGPTTIAPPIPVDRPSPTSSDPVVIMLADLQHERLRRQPAAIPPSAVPEAPPTVVEAIVASLQRLMGGGDDALAEGLTPVVVAQREVVAIEPEPAPAAPPAPTPASLEQREAPPPPDRVAMVDPAPQPALPAPRTAAASAPVPPSPPARTGPIDLTELDEDLDLDLLSEEGAFDEADLFVAPTIDEAAAAAPSDVPLPGDLEDLEDLDSDTILVEVLVDEPDVPIRIDGEDQGTVPGVLQVPAGIHSVELYYKGEYTRFTIPASVDPERWCFERKGRGFKRSEC